MDPQWHHQNPHQRRRQRPKLTSAGRIDATVDGRPLEILAEGADILIRVPNLKTALALRKQSADTVRMADALLTSVGGRLRVKVSALPEMTVSPRRGVLARLVMPRT